MQFSGAAWSFVGASLRESRDIYRALGVNTIDLLAAPGFLLDSARIVDDPEREAREIAALQTSLGNLMFLFASDFSQRATNHIDSQVRSHNGQDFRAVVHFCRLARIPSVTVVPGIEQEGWSHEKSLAVSAEALNEFASIAAEQGIVLLFEAHVGSILESPLETQLFLQNNPQLKLTLDYSHFIFNGHSQAAIDILIPYARHVHLRQAGPRVLQARWNDGTIDFVKLVEELMEANYEGYLVLEYEHDAWLDNDRVDVATETIKMRNAISRLVGETQPPEARNSSM
jgi:sugar phosphate isomerase/epimerase